MCLACWKGQLRTGNFLNKIWLMDVLDNLEPNEFNGEFGEVRITGHCDSLDKLFRAFLRCVKGA